LLLAHPLDQGPVLRLQLLVVLFEIVFSLVSVVVTLLVFKMLRLSSTSQIEVLDLEFVQLLGVGLPD
jgi:hypothetical protein